ncbi:MAG: aminomethyl-transferring glycine dehydrogenase subunit GcvPB [Desulfovermiculus sp.]
MNTHPVPGTSGLSMNEALLWERSQQGRSGFSLPRRDVPESELPEELQAPPPDLPDLSELDVVRHYTRLSQWNFGVDTGSYPLGSCTMKYNPKTNEVQAARPGFAQAHPLLPAGMTQGILKLMHDLQNHLAEITGLPHVTLQPAAGAHGEYTGMRIFYAYHHHQGRQRRKVLIPDTAHGTNPASAAMCGYQTVPVKSTQQGVLSAQSVAEFMDEDTAGIMVTNPNTLGLFEENIREIARTVHDKGGLVYCDGANFNALMGIVDMAQIGVDVLHLNLHKTFAAPHGGGGPGSGPVCVTPELEPFLPLPRIVKADSGYVLSEDFPQSIGRLHTFFGNVGVMIKAASYILSLGPDLKRVSQLAVLNANYIKERLKDSFHLPYDRPCMHECVFSDIWQEKNKVSTLDIAKRLIDFGFHPPTIYFPLVVSGAMMVEPTETESKEDLDRFVQGMRTIAKEAEENPQILRDAPSKTKVGRMDETQAARHPCLTG